MGKRMIRGTRGTQEKRSLGSQMYSVHVRSLRMNPKTGEEVDARYDVQAYTKKEAVSTISDMYFGTQDVPYGIWAVVKADA